MSARDLTVVVPVLDESARVPSLCRHLDTLDCPAIVVDGGSSDNTHGDLRSLAGPQVRVVQTDSGRARQMNFGASLADTSVLLFLHADTRLPSGGNSLALCALTNTASHWGRFDVSFDQDSRAMGAIAWFMNQRSALSGVCTGDQAIFTTAEAFDHAGRYPDIPLMEDIALSKQLLKTGPPARIRTPVVTADRRWRQNGILRTVMTMWWLRFLYFMGASPATLATRYGHAR